MADTEIAADAGSMLLEACKRGDWIGADMIVRGFERLWNLEEGHSKVREAVNFQDLDTGVTPMIAATRDSRSDLVERLANLGADANSRDKENCTALHYATASLKEDMVKLLISSGADCSIPGGKLDRLPLHLACLRRHGALPVVQYLALLSGEDARLAKDKEGKLPLWLAVEKNHMHVVRELLLERGLDQLSYRNDAVNGDTIMHQVIRKKQTEFLEIFLEAGAPVNVQNDDGQTLLHVAAVTSNEPAIILLHRYNASLEVVDKYERTPLHLAVEKGLEKVVDILTERYPGSIHFRTKDGSTLAHIAALSGHPETVLTLLRRGVYLHMPNKTGATCLHAAARTGHASVVKALLSRGSKVDAKTKDNYTPLHLAIEYGKPGVVEVVLGAGASVHIKGSKNGETPLHIAARVPNGDLATTLLLKCGANVNTPMENGETALHVAARAGSMMMVKLLLKEGADPMATSLAGETSFQIAVRSVHYEIAKTLIEFVVHRFDRYDAINVVNMANVEGETALHFIAEILPDMTHESKEDLNLLQLALDYSAAAETQTKLTYETPLHYCARSGNERVLSAMLKGWGHMRTQTVINRQSKTGWSPLITACEGGRLGIVKILLKNNARVDIFDEAGKAALHLAAENGHLEIVDYLLRNKAFVNAKTKSGYTALHLACMKGWPDIVKLLVEKYEAPVDSLTMNMKSPLHLASQYGKKDICEMLLQMGANPNATDDHGQNPLHIAAECDNEEVVQLFLKILADKNPLTIADIRGNTIAHIAAKNGSIDVLDLLLRFSKEDIINNRNRGGDSVLHVAAALGHAKLVTMLTDAGASVSSENSEGLTPFHLAAKNGHLEVIEILRGAFSPKTSSMKNGLTALHLACYFGQAEAAREILTSVPATIRSDEPTVNTSIGREIGSEAGLTPLHVACKAGQEAIVRMILNYPGVQVDQPTDRSKFIPLHMASLNGHSSVVGLLLSRFGNQLDVEDAKGQTPLMLAASRGHLDMASLLITQGASLDSVDKNGWTALHCAAVAGHHEMTKLLCSSGADTTAETNDKKIALCYAAHSAHTGRGSSKGYMQVMSYLMKQQYDCFALLEDKIFLIDLMLSSKSNGQKPMREFIEVSPSPVELALKLSHFYWRTAESDKYHAKDLLVTSRFCQTEAGKLLTVACTRYRSSDILRGVDRNKHSLLDIMVTGMHKETVALLPIQQYLSVVFNGGLNLRSWQIALVFLVFFCMPPVWLFFSMPLPLSISEVPFLKLVVQITSHLYFIILMILVFMSPFEALYARTDLMPRPEEWLLLFWILGYLTAELTTKQDRKGLGALRIATLIFAVAAVFVHCIAALVDIDKVPVVLYVRSQLLATACFFADIQILSFLSFHQLFGPFGVMIGKIMNDLMRFLVFFGIFLVGFTFVHSAIFEDIQRPPENTTYDGVILDMVSDPLVSMETLYWAIFGMIDPKDDRQFRRPQNSPSFAYQLAVALFGIYLMATIIVLVNLLIAMLSDTYQRIKARSDLEWKFIRSKIIINLEKTPISPPPFNTFFIAGRFILDKVAALLEQRALAKIGASDGSISKEASRYSKIHMWRKSLRVDDADFPLDPPFSKKNPVKKLVDVIPWADVVAAGEDFEYGVSLDDFA